LLNLHLTAFCTSGFFILYILVRVFPFAGYSGLAFIVAYSTQMAEKLQRVKNTIKQR